jgi:hypothetical protein
MTTNRLSLGDIFEIPLSNGRRAFGQYVFKDRMGPVVLIFDVIAQPDEGIELESLDPSKMLFPPVFTGLQAAIRSGLWKVIGHRAVGQLLYPGFVSAHYNHKTGRYGTWYLWDGEEYRPLGQDLPQEYRTLERLIIWDPMDIIERIESGDNPYEYPRHGV